MDKPGEMQVFVRVVEDGGFSAAARGLGLTPSAISKVISRLESRLGVRLMHRTTRAFNLTHEGVSFYQRSARILRDIDEAEEAISQFHAEPRGTLKVNAAVAFATYQVAPLLPTFFERFPNVHIELTVTDRVVDVVEDSVDVAIRIGTRIDPSLMSRLLAEDHRVICASPEYLRRRGVPLEPADLTRHDCLAWIGNQGGLNEWPFSGADGPYTLPVRGHVDVNSGEALYELTRAGVGISRIAEFRVGDDIQAGRLVSLLEAVHRPVPLPIHVICSRGRHLVPKVRAFVDFLVESFTPEPPWRRQRDAAVSGATPAFESSTIGLEGEIPPGG
jgi:DNA-binding transcriptional LysR family regulator